MFEKFLKENNISFKRNYDFGSEHGYKTPGIVNYYIETDSIEFLNNIVNKAKQNNLKIIPVGEGSNLLIKDFFNGVLIKWNKASCALKQDNLPGASANRSNNSSKVFLELGSAMKKSELTDYCVQEGLSGLEFWAGIPGLVGGGLAMNAGAYDKDMKGLVESIQVLTAQGLKNIEAKDLKWSYRKLQIPESSIIISAVFVLNKKDPTQVKTKVDEYICDREKKHPLEYPSCGSVFKNPSCDKGAWFLVKDAGFSGFKLGGAMVSTKHTNFIINSGGAKASDVLELIALIKNKVKAKFDIELEEELRLI
jgi:UDP-N-acetylmuramate dehydrogenase